MHSHMMGVLPEYQNQGIGHALKMRQKEDALARGIDLIEWTFDPLDMKNAYFNVERLGAIVRRYVRNQYGVSSSMLHGGLPTDRCVAEWWIAKDRVKAEVVERIEVPPDIRAARVSRVRLPIGLRSASRGDSRCSGWSGARICWEWCREDRAAGAAADSIAAGAFLRDQFQPDL